jgi:hypothetical protein
MTYDQFAVEDLSGEAKPWFSGRGGQTDRPAKHKRPFRLPPKVLQDDAYDKGVPVRRDPFSPFLSNIKKPQCQKSSIFPAIQP